MSIYTKKINTPAGAMIIGANDQGICLFDFEHRKAAPQILQRVTRLLGRKLKEGAHPFHDLVEAQVAEYFSGARTAFDLPLQLAGSAFQQKVWQALLEVPYGETRTYLQQSKVLGDVKAIRAVAGANGANCLAIIVPCHRVVGANQSLTGYAGGLAVKQMLLAHEQKHRASGYQETLF